MTASGGRYVEIDGRLMPEEEACVSALDRGFTLGDGVFETMLAVDGFPYQVDAHLARLRLSGSVLALPVPRSDVELKSSVDRVLAANDLDKAVVRITVSRGVPTARGLIPPAEPNPTTVIQASEFYPLPTEKRACGFSVAISAIRRNEHSPTSRIKSCSYLDNVLARFEAHRKGFDEAVMLNTSGAIACCTSANLFFVKGNRLITPSIECGVLAGVTRQAVIQLAATLGILCREGVFAPEILPAASEAFLTNSVLGVVPVTAVDGSEVADGKPGVITRELAKAYEALAGIAAR